MNREIKFRAWDKHNKKMFFWDIKNFDTKHASHYDNLMQYTGLKDKNGKEIYEGDVVRWGMYENSKEHYHRYASVSLNPDIQFSIIYYVDSKTLHKKKTDNYVFTFGEFAYKDTHNHLEVIGNIYENPELIKANPEKL